MLYELIKNEIKDAMFVDFDEIEGDAWFRDGTAIAYRVDAMEENGCWISSKIIEPEGGTVWEWTSPMFYPYKG